MRIEIQLDDGSSTTIENASRVFERDARSLYVYDGQHAVLAVVAKAQVVRLVTGPDRPVLADRQAGAVD